jgi:hypothetical protein
MTQLTDHSTLIDKEKIGRLQFPSAEVLSDDMEKIKRMVDLKRANELGDVAQFKVVIYFEDSTGVKMVETTVWKVTSDSIHLKYGISIPISRIHKVVF